MNSLSSTELSRMRSHAEATMFDTCVVMAFSAGSKDEFNRPAESWADGSTVVCGFKELSHREVMPNADVEQIDARIRLPIGTALDHRDKIRLTKRLGSALASPITFRIVGEPIEAHSALQADLILDDR